MGRGSGTTLLMLLFSCSSMAGLGERDGLSAPCPIQEVGRGTDFGP
jgi:hypothetical protein